MIKRLAQPVDRLAVVAALVEMAPRKLLGRTAVMKLMYFLQSVRNVPLGYSFSLYTYGPYDSQVLDDLDYGQALGILSVSKVSRPSGYGFEIKPGHQKLGKLGSDFVSSYEDSVEWVMKSFGSYGAADLELVSTILFVYRESIGSKQPTAPEIIETVRIIKPHFTTAEIKKQLAALSKKGLVKS